MGHASTPTVAILQPYLPQYRVPFFEGLRGALGSAGVDLQLAYGTPGPSNDGRLDDCHLEWATQLGTRVISVGDRSLASRQIWPAARDADLLIAEDAMGKPDSYRYLLGRRRKGKPTALWGHARSRFASRAERTLRVGFRNQADWYFAYTDAGKSSLSRSGFPSDRVTSVRNSVDIKPLLAAADKVEEHQVRAFRDQFNLKPGHAGLFLGSLDASKGLPLLVAAGDTVAAEDPLFRLVVLGDGPERSFMEDSSADRDWLVLLGAVFDPEAKAVAAAASDLLIHPKVGLVAVDSFALGTPIVTTDCERQTPEFEYLRNEDNAMILPEDPAAYAAGISRLLKDSDLRGRLSKQCRTDAAGFGIPVMVKRFADGAIEALSAGVRTRS